MGSERKVFSEQEVTAVVRRAVQLQEQAERESFKPGVTPEELNRIAGELGIESRYLLQAIDEARSNSKGKRGGIHWYEEFERVVDSELSPDDYDVLLKYIRPTRWGHVAQVGRSLTGNTWTGASMASFDVTAKRGRTRIRVKSNSTFAFLVSLYPAIFGSVGLLAGFAGEGRAWLGLLLFSIILVLGWCAFTALSRFGHRAGERLTNRLAESIVDLREEETDDLALSQSEDRAGTDEPEVNHLRST